MKVSVADRRFSDPARRSSSKYYDPDPYTEAVERAGGCVEYNEFETESEVIEGCRDADVVVAFKAPITRAVIEELEECRLVFRVGAGFDNVDIRAANEHGLPVSTLRGYANDELSEHAIALMLAAQRDIVTADRDMRAANGWGEREPVTSMHGKTFGIVGLGEIGRSVAPKAQGLAMDVVATDPYVPDALFDHLGVEEVSFDDLLDRSDCISLHCQLTAQTHHLFSTAEFELMKEEAVLVNTARGPLVDERALVEAVESGQINGAGLDVFETEPPVDTPALECDGIVCSPHHGSSVADPEKYERTIEMVSEEVVRALRGDQLEYVVNPEALKYDSGLFSPEH